MLVELRDIVQDSPNRVKRCFMDSQFTLFVWLKNSGKKLPAEFQLVHKSQEGHLLIWHEKRGFELAGYDDGEQRPGQPKMSPLVSNSRGPLPTSVLEKLRRACVEIDQQIGTFVLKKVEEFLKK